MGDEERAAAEVGEALKEVSLNGDAAGDPAAPAEEAPPLSPRGDPSACAHCSRVGATRRCAKRHQKCLQRLFCDKVCEEAAHKKKPQQAVKDVENLEKPDDTRHQMSDAEKLAKAKKKKAKKAAARGKKASSDQFWWNNSVYASW